MPLSAGVRHAARAAPGTAMPACPTRPIAIDWARMNARAFLCLGLVALAGCSGLDKDPTDGWEMERLYAEARGAMQSGDYEQAKAYYRALEGRSPFGVYGQQALLDLAYVYYKTEESDRAIETCERFIKTYPQNQYVDYAYYLRGLAEFHRSGGLAQRFVLVDLSQRDPEHILQAFEYFSALVSGFPDSIYVADSAQRMVYLRNLLADHEVEVAHYYMRRGAYLAAANRARYAVEHYPRTGATPDALAVMARAYQALGLAGLAADALRVMELNYPRHPELAALRSIRRR